MSVPAIGSKVTIVSVWPDEPDSTGTVVEHLSTQFTARCEVQRKDGGWHMRTLFGFYRDEGTGWSKLIERGGNPRGKPTPK